MFDPQQQFTSRKSESGNPSALAWRRTAIGIGLSLLIHGLLLFIAIRHRSDDEAGQISSTQAPLIVHLSQAAAPPRLTPPALTPAVPVAAPIPVRKPMLPHRTKPVISLAPTLRQSPPVETPLPAPVPEPTVAPPPTDMLAMLNAARERRNAANRATAGDDTIERAPSSNDIAMANINRSLQSQSNSRYATNGVFQILHMGPRMAEFSFRGWTTDSRRNWRQVIEVDGGPQGDVERAVVRRMIELIRSHFDGDFNWDSHRLGHVIVLSARLEDNKGLEDFLMHEFFDGPG